MASESEQQRPASEFSNNIVAQSDYEVAMEAIESTFTEFQQQVSNVGEGLDQDRIAEIYQAAKESVMRNFNRIVHPVVDNDFHDYVDQYHIILPDANDDDDDDEDIDKEIELATIEEEMDEEEEELDEEELVDHRAWKDAQKLRTRIRTMSQTVQNVRARILKQTEDSLVASLDRHLVNKKVEIVEDGENLVESTSGLQKSLQALSQILQDSQWTELPLRIQSLQETIEAIQKEKADDRPLSQTEIAILSQSSETNNSIFESSRKLLEESAEYTDSEVVTAMDRLAMLGQYF
jgi:hypothetical protein